MISTNPEEVIKYIHNYNLDSSSPILSSAVAYQYLYLKHFIKVKPIKDILEENKYDIELIGPGHTKCTGILECMFGKSLFCHTHSILHDAYGRIYKKYGLGRGYCYALKRSKKFMNMISLLGHITGFIFALTHKI